MRVAKKLSVEIKPGFFIVLEGILTEVHTEVTTCTKEQHKSIHYEISHLDVIRLFNTLDETLEMPTNSHPIIFTETHQTPALIAGPNPETDPLIIT